MHATVPKGKRTSSVVVPAYNFIRLLADYRPSVLKVDIQGEEYSLPFADLPICVRAVVIELHLNRGVWFTDSAPKLAATLSTQFKNVRPPRWPKSRGWTKTGEWSR